MSSFYQMKIDPNESVSSKLAITIIKQRVVVSFIKGTSTPTGLIIPVINNDLFLTVTDSGFFSNLPQMFTDDH
jgi:hypothetical protein